MKRVLFCVRCAWKLSYREFQVAKWSLMAGDTYWCFSNIAKYWLMVADVIDIGSGVGQSSKSWESMHFPVCSLMWARQHGRRPWTRRSARSWILLSTHTPTASTSSSPHTPSRMSAWPDTSALTPFSKEWVQNRWVESTTQHHSPHSLSQINWCSESHKIWPHCVPKYLRHGSYLRASSQYVLELPKYFKVVPCT